MNQASRENSALRDDGTSTGREISVSMLLKSGVVEVDGKPCGRIEDVVVMPRHNDYAQVTGIVAKIGNDTTFFLTDVIVDIRADALQLKSEKLGHRHVELAEGEISLNSDVLSERVIDVGKGALVKVYDVRLARQGKGWAAVALDVHRGRWFGFGSHASHAAQDWRNFLPLGRESDTASARSSPTWIGRLKPHQIADLIEDATAEEQDKLLEQVHTDPELEADVFQELEEDSQAQVFKSLMDAEVAEVLSRMRADDAADAVMELAQHRRQRVLDLLPVAERTKVMTLLGYNEATAGGLMGTEFIALPEDSTVGDALQRIREAKTDQPEALITIHSLGAQGKLSGTLGLVQALQANPDLPLQSAADQNVVTASPEDDISKVVTRMADFNLLSLPVVDDNGTLLGIVTVDDALEAALPAHWANR
ncbi:MAG TPA: CBS domain-containing protein [Sphingomicrobium sp.]|nr:CBS domain-containing protein [Sphingomicrobium sp.]